jgi:hypothetical protein
MGNVQVATYELPWNWKNEPPNGIGGNYDDAGYIPDGLTYPPQNSWNEALNYGGDNTHMRFNIPNTQFTWGATEGLLTSFGTINQPGGYPQLYDIAQGLPNRSRYVDGEYMSVKQQPKPYSTWKSQCDGDTCTDLPTCTPDTFPNCTMQQMMEAGGEASFFDGKTQNAGRIYADSVNRAYAKAFVGGGIEALQQVNTSEHSTFDPCSGPGLLELLLPLGAAAAGVAIYSYYGKPELTLAAGSQVADAGMIVVFGFMYNYSKGLLEYLNEPSNIHFERAARFLVYPAGIYGGYQLGTVAFNNTSQQGNQTYFQISGAAVGVSLSERWLVMPVSKALSKGSFLGGLLLGGFGFIMRGMSHFWCALTTNQDSCTALDQVEFQDSRRWDAASIAAMLTLEVCEREGWTKDTAEAQFVFRGLLSGPALMTAPMTSQSAPTIFDQTLANPMGYTYAGRWQQEFPAHSELQHTRFKRSHNIYGWDGDVAGWGDMGNSNLYSCENWDVMREGLQQNTHPGTKALKRKFDSWIGNWKDPGSPAGVLVAAAKVHANIEAMKHIPGWELEDATNLTFPDLLKPTLLAGGVAPLSMPDTLQFGSESGYQSGLRWTPPAELQDTYNVFPIDKLNEIYTAPLHPVTPYDPSYCGQVWADMMNGEDAWASFTRLQVRDQLRAALGVTQCAQSDTEDVGKVYVLQLALSAGTDLTCHDFVLYLTQAGWDASTIQHALYTVAQVVQAKIPDLAEWALGFLQECTDYSGMDGSRFDTLPKSITSKWCT